MNTLPIYFHKTVEGVAKAGEVKNITAAYARNVLIPKKLGSIATADLRAQYAQHSRQREKEVAKQGERGKKIIDTLTNVTVSILANADPEGTLYAAVKPADIAAAIKKQFHIVVPDTTIKTSEPIKKLGEHAAQMTVGEKILTLSLIIQHT
ncbi:MAG: 50S ribosomal protein L9 [Patescibacteria group bacterium]|jgi:ribosomal protein L9